jgi:ribokinase
LYRVVQIQRGLMKIAVIGSYGVGMTMRVPRFPAAGETLSGGRYSAGPGGKGSNQAIGAARLGAAVSLLTAVGPDQLGYEARELWARERIDASRVITGVNATMVGFILVEDSGENRIAIAPGALEELTPAHVEAFRAHIADADIVIISMEIPLPTVTAALRVAHEEGTRTLLNPAPATALPEETWAFIDVLTPNQTEAPILLGLDLNHGLSNEELVTALHERTGAVVIMTLGSAGALLHDGDNLVALPPTPAPRIVDTTGAGDSFTAALAVALAEGQTIRAATRFAAAAGSHAVTIEGVIDSLPMRGDIDDLLAANR